MKKITCLFVLLFIFNLTQGQDTFTYKKVKSTVIDKEKLQLTGAAENKVQEVSINSAASMSTGGSGINETEGQLSVSLSGGALYKVPIAVPPGINSIEPAISLSYNSQAGSGLAGYGWNISGVSLITRIPSSDFHDGEVDPVDFDTKDRFAFEGQRMILKSGTHGTSGAVYETERYSNVKITAYGTSIYGAAYGPGYFQVKYPDGSYAYYGLAGDSRSKTDYAISYWRSPHGVYIHYNYSTSGNGLSIKKIRWGGRSSSAHMNEIEFIYGTRKRYEHSYIGGQSFVRTNLLKEIKVKGNGVGYRNYVLNHNYTSLGYDRLTSVQEKSGDNTLSHSPINFTYTNTSTSIASVNTTYSLSVSNIEQRNAEAVSLDLTGNGKMDFTVFPKSSSQRNKFWVFKEIQSGYPNYAYEVNTGGRFEALFPVTWLTHNNKILAGQGIGIAQNYGSIQVKFKVYSNGTANPIYYQYEKVWNAPTYTSSYTCGTSNTYRVDQKYISGDFNGDGLSDVIAISKPYSYSYCYETLPDPNNPCGNLEDPFLSNYEKTGLKETKNENTPDTIGPIRDESRIPIGGDDTCCQCTSTTSGSSKVSFINLDRRLTSGFANSAGYLSSSLGSSDRIYAADVNGDGKTDILQVKSGRVYVYTLKSNNYIQLLWQTSDSRITTSRPIMIGDYNGDGKADFMTPTGNNSYTFATFLSTGTGFVKRESSMPYQYKETNWNGQNGTLYGYNLIPVDINGDGRTDVVDYRTTTYNSSSNGTQYVRVYHNTYSTSTNGTPAFSYSGYASRYGNLKHFPIPIFLSQEKANANLDFGSISNNWVSSFRFTKDHREDVLLRSVNSNGLTHSIRYNSLDYSEQGLDYMPVYQYTYDNTYPYVDIEIAPGTKVVTALQRISSGDPTLKQIYSYKGAVTHLGGLGFQGFSAVARSNWHTGNSDRLFTMTKHSTALRGAVTSEYQAPYSINFTSVPSNFTTKNTYTYQSSLSASKVFKLTNTSIVEENRLENTTTTQSFIYDSYNNPTKATTNYSGQATKVVDVTYANSTGSTYYIGRATKKIETSTIGAETFRSEEQYVYSGWNVSQKKTKGNGTNFNTDYYYYDVFGNIIRKVTTPYGSTSREVKFEYDSSGRFMTKSINIEGLATTYQYNANNGTLTREVNTLGHATNYLYDSWFRMTRATDYLGKKVTTAYSESSNQYSVTVTGDDGASKISKYDLLKRLILEQERDVTGQWVKKSYVYDKFDRTIRESEPYTGSSATQWNDTEYDFYGRVSKLTSFTGKVTNISYSGLTSTVNDGTKTVVTTKNAIGKTVSVQDPGGTVTYSYFGNGELKTANYGGVIVRMEQDGWGRRTKLIDPSAGTYTFEYNGFGDTTKETTPKGNTVNTYNNVGKLTQKTVSGDLTNMSMQYTYDATSKQLKTITLSNADGNNSNYTYTYDSYKRVSSITENNAFARFIKRYTYDAFGRIYTEEFDGKVLANNKSTVRRVKNTYTYGEIRNIKDYYSNELLWSVNSVNARGQVVSSSGGVGLTKSNTYNSHGFLTQAVTNKVTLVPLGDPSGGVQQLMKLNYNFNTQRGILNSRSNSLFNWNETFQYDSLDRLISYNDNTGNQSQSYDSRGRITSESRTGTYDYNGNSYQLASLTLNGPGQNYFNNYTRQQISYNAFKSPVEIYEYGKDRISFQYNAFMKRSHRFYGGTQSDKLQRRYRKHYSFDGSMEATYDKQTGKVTFVAYIGGDAYTAPAIWHSEQGTTTSNQYYYLHRDYLGSILAITDKNGAFKEKRHFDAWGNVVKLTNGSGSNINSFTILDRGYTGHEHLQGVGLVHMNGRLYDSKIHRFLSPDNYMQDPYNTQNFNRYAYVLNNPLKFTDPNGEFFWFAVLIGAAIGAISQALKPGATFGSILAGALIGAAAGLIGAGVGSVVAGGSFFGSTVASTMGFWSGAAAGAAGGFAGGFVGAAGNAWLNGSSFGEGLVSGIKAALIGGVTGGIAGGISGGINAVKNGREFWSGEKWQEITLGYGGEGTSGFTKDFELGKKWDTEFEMKISRTLQKGEWDCTHACKLSVDKYYSTTGQSSINSKWLNYVNSNNGMKNTFIQGYYKGAGYQVSSFGNGYNGSYAPKNALPWMLSEMKANRIVQIGWYPKSGYGHASLVTKIKFLADFSKYRITIMDPGGHGVRATFKNIYQIFSVWK
jgi:RHS repeat-associated protein